MSQASSALEESCAAHGLRMTGQRRLVITLIADAKDHPDAVQLHDRARAVDPTVSLATIYRTLKTLEALNLVDRHDFGDGRARYEHAEKGHHDHLIDLETGTVIEFQDDELESLKAKIAERLGYTLKEHRLELYGSAKR
ncbi:MAG: Fur family transcriptional regulator [Pseudomonadota bacterium]